MPLTGDPWLPYNSDGSVPICRRAAPVGVFRFDGVSTLAALPNVECLGAEITEGTSPGTALFRYNLAMGQTLSGAPYSVETALGTGFTGAYVVDPGDRLVVLGTRPDGVSECLFDGLAVDFGMGLDPDTEEVQIACLGIGWRSWDHAVGPPLMRNAWFPRTIDDKPVYVQGQFNPDGKPNCTPDGYMAGFQSGAGDFRYPTFLDPAVVRSPDARTYWTLSKACRYLLNTGNPTQQFVLNPDGVYLDNLLVSGNQGGDTSAPIRCPDTPITGKDWPGLINGLVGEQGFGTYFGLSTSGGLPVTGFNIYAARSGSVKELYLGAAGTPFDPTLFNVQATSLHRDTSEVVNQMVVRGGPTRWEVSVVLACGFPMTSSDASVGNLKTFGKSDPAFVGANRNAYRLYVYDECGEGYYNPGTASKVTGTPYSFDAVFGKGKYAIRRRPGIGDLISKDDRGKPLDARISISTNYTGPAPGIWDGSGQWQAITTTTWRLLPDRLGIEITDENPNSWQVGKSLVSGDPFPAGTLNAVEKQATTSAGNNFFVRLTCVIESDRCCFGLATPTGDSPLPQVVSRVVDASDRFRNEAIYNPSELNTTGNPIKSRDDSAAALAEAQSMRSATEAGVFGGSVTIPRLTTYYKIGDRIDSIEGRNLGLRTDGGTGLPVYPVVVGVAFEFGDDSQATVLQLSDAGTHRKRYEVPAPRRPRPRRKVSAPTRVDRTGYEAGHMAPKPQNAGGYIPKPGDDESPWG